MALFTDRNVKMLNNCPRIKLHGVKRMKRVTRATCITTLKIIIAVTSILLVSINCLKPSNPWNNVGLRSSSSFLGMKGRSHSLRLRMAKGDSSDPVDPAKAGERINFLINSAVELIKRFTPKKTKSSVATSVHGSNHTTIHQQIVAEKKDYKSVRLSFSSSHRQLITLSNAVSAHQYLSLPVEEYSVLDSNLITRIRGVRNTSSATENRSASKSAHTDDADANNRDAYEDRFVMTLPLGDITSGASTLGMTGMPIGPSPLYSSTGTGGGSYSASSSGSTSTSGAGSKKAFRLDASVRTEVSVRPDPENGRVIMESGPIFFVPTPPPAAANKVSRSVGDDTVKEEANEDSEKDSDKDGDGDGDADFMDSLPPWLVWGGVERQNKIRKNEGQQKRVTDNQSQGPQLEKESGNNNIGSAPKVVEEPIKRTADGNDVNNNIVPASDDEGKIAGVIAAKEEGAKSSVQARFRVELKWDPDLANEAAAGGGGSTKRDRGFKKGTNAVRSFISSLSFRSNKSPPGVPSDSSSNIEAAANKYSNLEEKSDAESPSVDATTVPVSSTDDDMISDVAIAVDEKASSETSSVNITLDNKSINSNINSDIIINDISSSLINSSSLSSSLSLSLSSMPVRASVTVWVDMNLPVRVDLYPALSFPPVGLLLSQAGALMTKAILSGAAPALSRLLEADYDKRMGISDSSINSDSNSNISGSSSGSSQSVENLRGGGSRKVTVNSSGRETNDADTFVGPYDHLTADL